MHIGMPISIQIINIASKIPFKQDWEVCDKRKHAIIESECIN